MYKHEGNAAVIKVWIYNNEWRNIVRECEYSALIPQVKQYLYYEFMVMKVASDWGIYLSILYGKLYSVSMIYSEQVFCYTVTHRRDICVQKHINAFRNCNECE